ncbi:electron transport complex subunit RsxG [Thiomicrorhabdus sp. zzn3]|uniref:electron transport complex subunit RsxG n=1 Tax=Thiomicrorhabdus sp. zzn3 TaxID=3039775 RepID=UPI0024370AA5|nr:electron transport complex subunit RsxG [Thiomicrorhabdus sp. zzn3]MDG6777842.1 electron transport complex subunit RsxG [Thiomicrorhabdus sp. zzn3]
MSAPSTPLIQIMLRSAGKLSAFVLLSILLLLGIKSLTDPVITEAEQQTLQTLLDQVMPSEYYDNQPMKDTLTITQTPWLESLGATSPVTIYRARKNGNPAGLVLPAIAPNGYSGNIYLLVGVLSDGRIAGVRVLKHKETPGLGDKIEAEKSPWIMEFDGRNLRDNNDPRWAVKKDGGDFDQFTGATITPRAVVQAVKRTLQLVNEHGDKLYE